MRRLLIALLAAPLLLLLLAATLAPLLLDENKILALATAAIERQTGAALTVAGDARISVFPRLTLALEQVSVAMPEEQRPSLQARALDIGVQAVPLLAGEVAIDTLALDGVTVRATLDPTEPTDTSGFDDAQLREFYLRRREAIAQAEAAAGAENALAAPLALAVTRLRVSDARLELSESGGGNRVIAIEEFSASDLNLAGDSISLEGRLALLGHKPIDLEFEGSVMIDPTQQILRIQGLAAKIRGALQEPLRLATSGEVDLQRQVADLKLAVDIAETHAEGQLRYASFESPQIDTQLRLNRLSPALLALAGPEPVTAESSDGEERGGDPPLPLDALRTMDTRASLSIEEVLWDGHRVSDVRAKLRVVDGAAIFPSISGKIHGGRLEMKANLNARQRIARVSTRGQLVGVDIARGLAAAELEPRLNGSANLQWQLSGRGNSRGAITDSLRGPIEVQAENAVLTDLGVEQMLCQAVALVNREALSASFPASSSFEQLSARLVLGEGRARLQPLTARLADIRLTGKGALDIHSLDFNSTFTARLSPGLQQLDPACRVNQRISDLDWPVNCRGNIGGQAGDWCAVDSAAIIENLAGNELRRKGQEVIEEKLGKEAGELLKGILGGG